MDVLLKGQGVMTKEAKCQKMAEGWGGKGRESESKHAFAQWW